MAVSARRSDKTCTNIHASMMLNRRSMFLFAGLQLLFLLIFYSLFGYNQNSYYGQERTWNGGHPNQERPGSCWCNYNNLVLSADSTKVMNKGDYCLCTPNLAIDILLLSEDQSSVWLVRRTDTGQYAVLGGFVQVGESVEQAVSREVYEEMNYRLIEPIHLLGVYSNPERDSRRHTVSVVYYSTIPITAEKLLKPADDVKEVIKISLEDIGQYSLFSDHDKVIADFRALRESRKVDIIVSSSRSLCIYPKP